MEKQRYNLLIKYILSFVFIFEILSLIFYLPALAQTPPVQRDLSVTAIVLPQVPDFRFQFTTNAPQNLPQLSTITYTITYGASSSAAFNSTNTIVVDFNDDRAQDGTHVTDYVIGSASNGYNGAQPVVDLMDRTITWTISNLPAGTINQKLTFRLNTNSNYSGSRITDFNVRARMSNEYVGMPEQAINLRYLFDPARVTPGPTQVIPITPEVTPIPTPVPAALRINAVTITALSDDQATLTVTTNRPATTTIRYGTAPTSLNQSAQSSQFSKNNNVDLTNLKPSTTYYFRVTATGNGSSITSEYFTFTTANASDAPITLNNAVVITSGESVILSDIVNGSTIPSGILTTQTDYILTYTFGRLLALADFEVIVKDKTGLVIRTVHMSEKESRVYNAFLKSGDVGLYDIFVRLTDQNGNIVEQKVALLKSISRLQVHELGSNLPLADARVFLKRFNPQTNRFEPLDPKLNPSFTNNAGEIELLLPKGKYRAAASALFFMEKSVEFTLGADEGQHFPVISLQKDPFNFFELLKYLTNLLFDSFAAMFDWLNTFFSSSRLYNITAGIAVGAFAGLSLLLFSFRTDIRWRDLWPFFFFHLAVAANKHRDAYLYGIVTGVDKEPVSRARIEVIDIKTNIVLAHTMSHKSGRFAVRNIFKQQYVKIQVTKDGYAETGQIVSTDIKDLIKISLTRHEATTKAINGTIKHTFGELFEILLLISLIAELIFLFNFGVARTLPFFFLSVVNLLLWIFFQRERKL